MLTTRNALAFVLIMGAAPATGEIHKEAVKDRPPPAARCSL